MSGNTNCISIGDEGSMCPMRGRDSWAGSFRSEARGSEVMGLIIDPLAKVLDMAGKIKVFWSFKPVEDLGGQMAVRKMSQNLESAYNWSWL